MANSPPFESFAIAPGDPLADAHADVSAWVDEAVGSLGERQYYDDTLDLKDVASGKKLLGAKPNESRRHVLAAIEQVRHWDGLCEQIRAGAANEVQRANAVHLPGWGRVDVRREHALAAITALTKRSLPFEKHELIALLDWSAGRQISSYYLGPLGNISAQVQRYASQTSVDHELSDAIKRFAERLSSSTNSEAKRLASTVQQLCAGGPAVAAAEDAPGAGCASAQAGERRQSARPRTAQEPPGHPCGGGAVGVRDRAGRLSATGRFAALERTRTGDRAARGSRRNHEQAEARRYRGRPSDPRAATGGHRPRDAGGGGTACSYACLASSQRRRNAGLVRVPRGWGHCHGFTRRSVRARPRWAH